MAEAIWHPSPNFGERRGVAAPDMIMLHYTAMTSAEAARDALCNPDNEVSAHYVLAEDGRLWQLVREEDRAWHAGRGRWGACGDVNSRSIGIEIANTGFHPFPEPQMRGLEELMRQIMRRWDIPVQNVIGHSDAALGRKTDPGGRFDWRRLARMGLSVWPDRDAAEQGRFFENAVRFGYDCSAGEDLVLAAFRLRFCPWRKGPLGDYESRLMADLAARWPVLM